MGFTYGWNKGHHPTKNQKCLGLSEAVMLHLEFSNADEGVGVVFGLTQKWAVSFFFLGGGFAEFFF